MFQRGFKTRCEDLSLEVRHQLRVGVEDALPPERVAGFVGVMLWTPNDLSGLEPAVRDRLLGALSTEWSAITIAARTPVIVYNPMHSRKRRANTLMHELSHVMLDHEPGNMFYGRAGLALRTYDAAQEEEADWLAGCLLLPRESLLDVRKKALTNTEIGDRYGVSNDLVLFRLNKTGVDRQLGARRN